MVIKIIPSRRDLRLHHHGHEHVGSGADDSAAKARTAHADHSKWISIDRNGVVDYMRVGSESALPIGVAENYDRIALLNLIIRSQKQTANGRRYAKHVEVVAGDKFSFRQF